VNVLPDNNSHYPDIPIEGVALTNRELERLREKYGNAALEDAEAVDVPVEPAQDLARTGAGATGADDAMPVQGPAEPAALAEDLLPDLEPEPVREEEPEPADDAPADYSGFFTGADELLEELAPKAAAASFTRYIEGLAFDPHRGEMTAQAEWPGLFQDAPQQPRSTAPQPQTAPGRSPGEPTEATVSATDDNQDFIQKYLHYTSPADRDPDRPAAEDNSQAPLSIPDAEDPAPAPQEAPAAQNGLQKPLSFWQKHKQHKAPDAEVVISPAQPPVLPAEDLAEPAALTAEPSPEAQAPINGAVIIPAQADTSAEDAQEPVSIAASAAAQENREPDMPAENGQVAGSPGVVSRQDATEYDIADTGSGEALEAEKPQAENIASPPPASDILPKVAAPAAEKTAAQQQSAPDAGMRIIYRAPEAAAFNAEGLQSEPSDRQNPGKAATAGSSPYNKYIRVIYHAPDGTLLDEGETAPAPQAETAQNVSAEETAQPSFKPLPQEAPVPATAKSETAQAPASQAGEAEDIAEPETLDTNGAGTNGSAAQTAEETGAAQLPDAGILAELAAEKKPGRFKRFLRALLPQRADSAAEKIRKSVLVLSGLTILVCGGILLNSYIIEPAMSNRQIAKAIELKKNTSLDKNWPDIQSKYAGVDFPQGMLSRYAGLYVANRDFAGWLTIDGLGIDMPLVQGETNGDYLRTDFYGKPSRYGCCFFDYRNNIKTLNRNTIVYGHNMGSSDFLMFGKLEKYSGIEGFRAAPVIECNTLYSMMKWKVYAVFITNALPSQDNGYLFNYIFPEMENDDDFARYIAQIDRRKLYTTGVEILPSDKILTLSTCSYAFDDARLVVVARLIRPGESGKVDTSLATLNPSPKYPQIWYTKNGKTNPYQDDEKWYP